MLKESQREAVRKYETVVLSETKDLGGERYFSPLPSPKILKSLRSFRMTFSDNLIKGDGIT